MKRVLVTGGGGFVGSHAVELLARAGCEVHAVGLRERRPAEGEVLWHRADLLDAARVADLFREVRPTHLLHLAWYTEPGLYWESPENLRWQEASLELLRQFHLRGGKRVVMAGSCAEYDWNCGTCSEYATPLNPATPYGASKKALQEALQSYCADAGLSSAWGRIFFLFGPREHPRRLLPSVINAALRGEEIRCSHGNQLRDFLHVEDAAAAFVALLESGVGGAVNVASGEPVALRDVVLTAAGLLGARGLVRFGAVAVPENDPPLLVGESRRLRTEVGWRPRYDLAAGVRQTVEWWLDQPPLQKI